MGFEECIGVYHLNSAMKEIESSVCKGQWSELSPAQYCTKPFPQVTSPISLIALRRQLGTLLHTRTLQFRKIK